MIFVLGYPLPTVAWFFNGNPIDIEDQKKYRSIKPAVLEIKNIMEYNIGSYECEASNIFGKTRSETYLEILGKYLPITKIEKFIIFCIFRSSRSKVFFKIVVLKNFKIFTGKYLCWNLFLIKSEVLQLVKKRLQHR